MKEICIVMDFSGRFFDCMVQRGTLTEQEASVIVRKATSAIVYMYSKNIMHRDLKPETLLLQRQVKNPIELQVKIIDVGLSKCFQGHDASDNFTTGAVWGTHGYLAPEMLQRLEYNKMSIHGLSASLSLSCSADVCPLTTTRKPYRRMIWCGLDSYCSFHHGPRS